MINALPVNPLKVAYDREQHLIRFERYAELELEYRGDLVEDLNGLVARHTGTANKLAISINEHVDTINRLADEVTQRKYTVVALSNELLDLKGSVGHHKWMADHAQKHADDLWKRVQKAESNTSNILAVAAPFMGVAILLLMAFVVIGFTEARSLRMQLDEVAPTLVCEAP